MISILSIVIEQVYNKKMTEIQEKYEIRATGEVIDKGTGKQVPLCKIGYNNGVILNGEKFTLKDLVWKTHKGEIPQCAFIAYKTNKPVDMNKDDIENLKVVTWREYYGWSSQDIDPIHREIREIICNPRKYNLLKELKPYFAEDKVQVNLYSLFRVIISEIRFCNTEAMFIILDKMKNDTDLSRLFPNEEEYFQQYPSDYFEHYCKFVKKV